MSQKVLVTCASKYGATAEIAEKIGVVLRRADLWVDVLPVGDVQNLDLYQAVVLGSGIYIGQWIKSATAFLKDHEKSLAERPVWLFSSGPTGKGDPVELVDGWRLPAAVRPFVERIWPRDVAVFHGWIDPEKINWIEKWSIQKLVKKPFGDFRDWDMIVNWTTQIASAVKETELSPVA